MINGRLHCPHAKEYCVDYQTRLGTLKGIRNSWYEVKGSCQWENQQHGRGNHLKIVLNDVKPGSMLDLTLVHEDGTEAPAFTLTKNGQHKSTMLIGVDPRDSRLGLSWTAVDQEGPRKWHPASACKISVGLPDTSPRCVKSGKSDPEVVLQVQSGKPIVIPIRIEVLSAVKGAGDFSRYSVRCDVRNNQGKDFGSWTSPAILVEAKWLPAAPVREQNKLRFSKNASFSSLSCSMKSSIVQPGPLGGDNEGLCFSNHDDMEAKTSGNSTKEIGEEMDRVLWKALGSISANPEIGLKILDASATVLDHLTHSVLNNGEVSNGKRKWQVEFPELENTIDRLQHELNKYQLKLATQTRSLHHNAHAHGTSGTENDTRNTSRGISLPMLDEVLSTSQTVKTRPPCRRKKRKTVNEVSSAEPFKLTEQLASQGLSSPPRLPRITGMTRPPLLCLNDRNGPHHNNHTWSSPPPQMSTSSTTPLSPQPQAFSGLNPFDILAAAASTKMASVQSEGQPTRGIF